MTPIEILSDAKGRAISPTTISKRINKFGGSYSHTIKEIVNYSRVLDSDGEVFIKCASSILSNFKMTRSGPFHVNLDATLRNCWKLVGANLKEINNSVRRSGFPRDRYIVELGDQERKELISGNMGNHKKPIAFHDGENILRTRWSEQDPFFGLT